MASKFELTPEIKYKLLLEISHKVRDTLNLDTILNHLLDTVKTVVDYNAAGVFVLNSDLVHNRPEPPREMIAGVVRRGFDVIPSESDPMMMFGKGIIGHVIRTGEPVVVQDVSQDPRYVEGRATTRSEIAVPIVRKERAFGALNVESDRLGAYDESDIEVLCFFADAAAISIEKAMLHRQLVDQKRVEEQLLIARDMQFRLLPDAAPELEGYEMESLCIPTHEIGGDYYDYIPLDDGKLGIVIADVSGEGISAALIMTAFRALVRTHARSRLEPAGIARALNAILPEYTGQKNFVTLFYGELDPKNGSLQYANSGHNPPLLMRAYGGLEILSRTGPLLGVLNSARFTSAEVVISPGDTLVLYTDGIVETMSPKDAIFGTARLIGLAKRCQGIPPADFIQAIIHETQSFSGQEIYLDDCAIMVLRCLNS